MEAKDTVMGVEQIAEVKYLDIVREPDTKELSPTNRRIFEDKAIAKAQAEISFKAGRKEVVRWIKENGVENILRSNLTMFIDREWQAKLQEWGIEPEAPTGKE